MTTFTIDTENSITAWGARSAKTAGLESFANDDELANLAADWPGARLVEIWHSLTGVVPVKKFPSRSLAISHIWKQIQHLASTPAPQAQKQANVANATLSATARDGSKKARVLQLLRRPKDASLGETRTATRWQAHTVRGFMAGALKKAGSRSSACGARTSSGPTGLLRKGMRIAIVSYTPLGSPGGVCCCGGRPRVRLTLSGRTAS